MHAKLQTIEQFYFWSIFWTACAFLWSCRELETIDRCTITCYWMNVCDCTSVQRNSPLSGSWTADRKVKLNFHWYFPRACIPLGSRQDQWQWPRQEEGNLTFSWGLRPLLWMAGVNTSNQEQMFGFLTWPSPFHGNVENSGSDSASMPYPKWPGSTSLVLPLCDSCVRVQRLRANRGGPGLCLVLSSIRDAVTGHLELFLMPFYGMDFFCCFLLNHIALIHINGYHCAKERGKSRACFYYYY